MSGNGPSAVTRLWRWALPRRHRFTDWLLAVGSYPLVALLTVVGMSPDAERAFPLSLLARLFPPPLGSEPASVFSSTLSLAAILTALVIVPGAAAWAILYRRGRPRYLLAVGVVATLLFLNPIPMAIALYSHAAWSTDRKQLGIWSLVAAAVTVLAMWPSSTTLIVTPLVVVTPLTAGLWVGVRRQLLANRQQLIDNLRERSAQLEREQHLLAERAAAAERNRIAREMHDVVAHRVSLMVLHAGGLEVSATHPSTVESAALIRATGREALSELRELLGVLREEGDDAPTVPQPVLADLDRLIEGWRSAGMMVGLEVSGRRRPLSPRLERTVYRVVQEALTNAGKHAPGDSVRIRLDYGENELEVTVANHPPSGSSDPRESAALARPEGAVPAPAAGEGGTPGPKPATRRGPVMEKLPTSGYGLTGLRERLALAGGDLDAGPQRDHGWYLRAIVPVGTSPRDEPGDHER